VPSFFTINIVSGQRSAAKTKKYKAIAKGVQTALIASSIKILVINPYSAPNAAKIASAIAVDLSFLILASPLMGFSY
jgi:hypothetical protein